MKAITYDRYGSPDVLVLDDVPVPEPTEGQVLVAVKAVGLNPFDWHLYRGEPYLVRMGGAWRAPKQKYTIGADVAGTVVAVGSAVTGLKVGDEVFGEVGRGGCAEFVATSAANLVLKPASVSFEQAAATPMGALTALQGLRNGGFEAGQSVLVNGASGGVGHLAVQIARALGASRVAAVCSTDKAEMVRSLGADLVIDYTREDFTRLGERFDVIFDTVGTRHLYAARRALAPRGTFITVGGTSRGKLLGPATFMFGSLIAGAFIPEKVATLTDMQGTPEDFLLISNWLDAGTIRPVIDTVYPLEQTAEAMWQVEGGRVAGKVVVTNP